MSAWFLLPVVLLRPAAAKLTRIAAIRIAALVVAITVGALAIAPWLAWRYHVDGTKEDRAYYRQVSAQVTDAWHLANIVPLRIVMGDPIWFSRLRSTAPIIRTRCRTTCSTPPRG